MDDLLTSLKHDYPTIVFTEGNSFRWSPGEKQIIYKTGGSKVNDSWALLHEVGHALLDHSMYNSDFELLKLEVAAWEKAQQIQTKYAIKIDPDHIQNCLDTYREWLYQRSSCPSCNNTCLQTSLTEYRCFNCHSIWKVTVARFCRPYRLLNSSQNKKSPETIVQATFRQKV
jgi:hypothetical protein